MKCSNHPEKDVLSFCHSCGEYFCRECLTDGEEYYYCKKEECQRILLNENQLQNSIGENDNVKAIPNFYAGFWRRVAAFLIDYLLLIIPSIAILVFAGFFSDEQLIEDYGLFIRLFYIIIFWLYFSLMESSHLQGTIGKLMLKIKVTDTNGERISFGKATGRHFCKILSGFILGIGFAMAGFTKQKQALHDILANSLVVKKEFIHERLDTQSTSLLN